MLAETERFSFETTLAVADLDLERLTTERQRQSSFAASRPQHGYREVAIVLADTIV